MRPTRAIIVLSLLLLAKSSVLLVLFGASAALYLAQLSPALPAEARAELPPISLRELTESTAYLVSGLFVLIGALGILRVRGWGWLLAMIGQGIDLVLGLVAYVNGDPRYIQMLVDVLLVLYLNHHDVYLVFANAKRRDGALQVGHEESVAPLDAEKEAAIRMHG
jgi:hypothetical protein